MITVKIGILIITILELIFISCISNNEDKKDMIVSNKQDSTINNPIVKPEVVLRKDNDEYSDTISVFDRSHFMIIKVYSMSTFSYKLIKKEKIGIDTLIKETYTGCYFHEVITKDYNFDDILDIDIVSTPCNRSGANTIHHLYLNKNNAFKKINVDDLLNIHPVKGEKLIYGAYNGVWSFSVFKARWKADSIKKIEEHEYELFENNKYITKDIQYKNDNSFIIKIDTIDTQPDYSEYYINIKDN